MSGPLADIRVIDLTSAVLGPVATQILGDMGAEVIKVEPPQGDPIRPLGPSRHRGMGAYFLNTNRNKKSVVLDLKRPKVREALLRLAETADVFVHNMRLGAAERLGLDYTVVAARNPRIVYAAATGFRKDGAHRDRPSFDDVIQGESGLAALNGGPGGEPRYVPMAVCDKICGYVLASAIGMALLHRERTGEGQEVHVPMLETMVAFNLVDHLWHGVLAEPEKGLGYPRMLTPHRRPFPTKDGHICILATTDTQSRHLFEALDCPELADDERFSTLDRRTDNIDELYALTVERMRRRTTAEWRERLDHFDVPNGVVTDLEGLLADLYLAETGFFERVEHPSEGRMLALAVPVAFSATPGESFRLPPPRPRRTHDRGARRPRLFQRRNREDQRLTHYCNQQLYEKLPNDNLQQISSGISRDGCNCMAARAGADPHLAAHREPSLHHPNLLLQEIYRHQPLLWFMKFVNFSQ